MKRLARWLYSYLGPENSSYQSVQRILVGPAKAGETKRIHLEVASRPSVLTGQLARSESLSPTNKTVRLVRHMLDFDWRRVQEDKAEADDQGGFEFDLAPGPYGWKHEVTQAALCVDDRAGHLFSWPIELLPTGALLYMAVHSVDPWP